MLVSCQWQTNLLYTCLSGTPLSTVTQLCCSSSPSSKTGGNQERTQKTWKAFGNLFPQFLVVIVLVSLLLSLLDHHMILLLIGSESGWFGVLLATIVGSVTLIFGFVAFVIAQVLKRYRLFLVGLVVLILLGLFNKELGRQVLNTTAYQLKEMVLIIPPLFCPLGASGCLGAQAGLGGETGD